MQRSPRIVLASGRPDALAQWRQALPEGAQVVEAAEAGVALERTRALATDLLLLDLTLPGGARPFLQVLQGSRAPEEAIPVVAVGPSRADALEALREGALDALVDPVDLGELALRVECLLRTMAVRDGLRLRAAELERASLTDPLTGLGNRRQFDLRLREEFRRAERYRDSLALLLVDLDHFKAINDRHGHLCGDDLLRSVSGALGASVRSIDIVCRYGGEEFAVLLPRTSLEGAAAVARRTALAIAEARLETEDGSLLRVTASVGVATFPGEDVHEPTDLVRAADSALYRAKRAGRNRVCSYPSAEVPLLAPSTRGVGLC